MRVYPRAEFHRTGTKLYHLQNNHSLPSHAPLHNPLSFPPINKSPHPSLPSPNQMHSPHSQHPASCLFTSLAFHRTIPHHPLKPIHKQIAPPIPSLPQPNPLPTHTQHPASCLFISLAFHHITSHHITSSHHFLKFIHKQNISSIPHSNKSKFTPTFSTSRILSVHLRCLSPHHTTSLHLP